MRPCRNSIGAILAVVIGVCALETTAQEPVTPSTQSPSVEEARSSSVGEPTGTLLPVSPLRLTAVVGGVVAMLGGLWLVFARLRDKQQGFGPNALKALGLILFLPTLLIIAVAVPQFNTQTLAALLGTVAGYVLSHSKPEDS